FFLFFFYYSVFDRYLHSFSTRRSSDLLVTTVATSVTGFFFPFHGFTPALGVGVLSILILVATIAARYGFNLAGAWRWIYVIGAVDRKSTRLNPVTWPSRMPSSA